MLKKAILTENAPAPIGVYSQGVMFNGILFLSAQAPLDPKTMDIVKGDIKIQIEQCFSNLVAVLNQAGGSADNITKITVYLTDMANFAKVNEVMSLLFKEPYPARAAVQVSALPKNTQVAVEAIAMII